MTKAFFVMLATALIGALFLLGCPNPPPPPPVRPDAPATCFTACAHINNDLDCNSAPCLRVCQDVADQRFTDCLASASTCAGVDRCDSR